MPAIYATVHRKGPPGEKLREIEPDANKEVVVKKINNLRSNVRKEKKKYDQSLKSGASADDVYRIKLWYYDLFNFVHDQCTPRESSSNLDSDDENSCESEDSSNADEEYSSNSVSTDSNEARSTSSNNNSSHQPKPCKTKRKDESIANEVLESVRDHFKRPGPIVTEDRCDIIGKNVAMKLRALDAKQIIVAEKLINDLLFEAEIGNLTPEHAYINIRDILKQNQRSYVPAQQYRQHVYQSSPTSNRAYTPKVVALREPEVVASKESEATDPDVEATDPDLQQDRCPKRMKKKQKTAPEDDKFLEVLNKSIKSREQYEVVNQDEERLFMMSLNSNPATASKVVQKRRSQNPPELQEANKHMNIAFSTLNSELQSKKHQEDKENDDTGLFCKLLAKQLRDFPKEERDELMYEIHGLIINKRHRSSGRVLQPAISSPIYSRSSSAHGSYYSNDSLPRNISPSSHFIQQRSLYSDTSPQIIINRPSSSRSSPTRPTTQDISHQTLPVDQQSI
ncbi:unnamed protein product [Arctia plantaginis]|uniref:MADF domain-containing protein n=1 Tax=Arctia plantaginis TaxID=874455 RepID=A0A8S0Z9J9_ARCPL|nr:unnamed protein product [Arctia plantaginis]